MNRIRHCGIYVYDIEKMTEFYLNVFHMHIVCLKEADRGSFVDQLVGIKNSEIMITKLITDQGVENGAGDMVELVKVIGDMSALKNIIPFKFTKAGSMHIAFECTDIIKASEMVALYGGTVIVPPFVRENGNWLSFCLDPEGNCLEIIERSAE